MPRILQLFLGPRVSHAEIRAHPGRYVLPTVLMLMAAALLLSSFTQQYWKMTLFAPQYPKGLHVQAYLNHLTGDVAEIDGLNHYIGMRPLNQAAQLERATSLMALIALATLIASTIFIHTKWAAALTLPALGFPFGFLADLYYWLNHFGQNLDPHAALSHSVKPFTPPVLGTGTIGQFRTVAEVTTGWYMACAAAGLVVVGLYFHRRAYKPLVDRWEGMRRVARVSDAAAAVGELKNCSHRKNAASKGLLQRNAPLWFALGLLASGFTNAHAAQRPNGPLQKIIDAAATDSVITVPAGRYVGDVVIDRALTLQADGNVVIDGGGAGDVVRITAAGVTLRGFEVRGSGSSIEGEHSGISVLAPHVTVENNNLDDVLFGISFKSAPDGVIRNNIIRGKDLDIARRGDGIRIWQSNNVLVEGNVVTQSRDVVMWFADGVTLRRNHVFGCRYGMHFMYTHDNVIEDNRLEDNSVGAFLMYSRNLHVRRNVFARNRGPSGYGLGLKDMQGVVAEDNVFAGNRVGAYLDNPPIVGGDFDQFTRNTFAYNDLGIAFQPMVKQIAFTENAFLENIQQIAVVSSGNFGGNKFSMNGRGNFWSDYRGFDIDRDGIGDQAYRSDDFFENLMDREPAMRLFLYSPAQQALELAARAFPLIKPEPKVTDESPLMQPPNTAIAPDVSAHKSGGVMWMCAATLLGVTGLTLAAARPQWAKRGLSQCCKVEVPNVAC